MWPQPARSICETQVFPRHVMMMTRGTQGDVQPFVALARGLAETFGWLVTIVTELAFRDFIKSNSNVRNGAIRFRPSGGDTGMVISSGISKWAIQLQSGFAQATMLALAEAEFFPSEPLLYYWAQTMKPNLIIYSFTLCSLAILIGESIGIPILGFILQPTCIPSKEYPPVISLETHDLPNVIHNSPLLGGLLGRVEQAMTTHGAQRLFKGLAEMGFLGSSNLTELRTKRNLGNMGWQNSFEALVQLNLPIIVPINEAAFGGKPRDWHQKACFTEFISLSQGLLPQLPESLSNFIENSKNARSPLVAMGFSSMPISREKILAIAIRLVEANYHPSVIALVGEKRSSDVQDPEILEKSEEYKNQGRLYECPGAPYGRLFPEMDCLILHGGLGATSEALRAGVPTIVTGILLMDQRFWGARIWNLGIGPKPVHIQYFPECCVELVGKVLDEKNGYKKMALQRSREFTPKGASDGVDVNVKAVQTLSQSLGPPSVQYRSILPFFLK
eukprot:TRINITY_DN9707_c0_g1_i2.p1 TRINITY_DN9707_c0_g1~~TRINITY_DN9707_c0_g1_i2.p1  ORF type:complete len:565 (-),score=112.25 TRINITY_DN9707_c0_g1_i2:19-1527(-)